MPDFETRKPSGIVYVIVLPDETLCDERSITISCIPSLFLAAVTLQVTLLVEVTPSILTLILVEFALEDLLDDHAGHHCDNHYYPTHIFSFLVNKSITDILSVTGTKFFCF